jgi:hypothetical protein
VLTEGEALWINFMVAGPRSAECSHRSLVVPLTLSRIRDDAIGIGIGPLEPKTRN